MSKVGQKINELTVIEYLGKGKYKCLCDCGEITYATTHQLKVGSRVEKKNCGGIKHPYKYKNSPGDEFFFSNIDTQEKAYVAGFIAADGCIQPEANKIKIDLKRTDEDILLKIQKAIGHRNKLSYYHQDTNFKPIDTARLVIASSQMVSDLENIGITKHKSRTLDVNFDKIKSNHIKDFVRGEIDGDGCICITSKNKIQVSLITSSLLAKRIDDWTEKQLGFGWLWTYRKKENKETVTLRMSGKAKSFKLLNLIYGDATIYLDRKYNKYLDFLKIYNK